MRRRGLVVAACTAAGLLLALWVTNVGRVDFAGPPQDPFTLPKLGARTPPPVTPTAQTATPTPTPAAHPPAAVTWLADALRVLVLVGLAALLVVVVVRVVRLVRRWLAHRRNRPREEPFEPMLAPDADAVAQAVAAGAEQQFAALAHGSPRNAVVACWLHLEDAVESAGLPRDPAETSQEFTTRVLATYSVDADAIGRLARLYREARFSDHALGEPARTAATEALRRLHADLQVAQRAARAEADRREAEQAASR